MVHPTVGLHTAGRCGGARIPRIAWTIRSKQLTTKRLSFGYCLEVPPSRPIPPEQRRAAADDAAQPDRRGLDPDIYCLLPGRPCRGKKHGPSGHPRVPDQCCPVDERRLPSGERDEISNPKLSLPGLTRQSTARSGRRLRSIELWMRGSSPRMTTKGSAQSVFILPLALNRTAVGSRPGTAPQTVTRGPGVTEKSRRRRRCTGARMRKLRAQLRPRRLCAGPRSPPDRSRAPRAARRCPAPASAPGGSARRQPCGSGSRAA